MSECTHNCSTCGENCGERTEPHSLLKDPNPKAHVGKVYGIVSGKGGVRQGRRGQVHGHQPAGHHHAPPRL